ncbi:MAG: TrpR YerC/YecD [Lachnospiraceae bacterium]|nr:TrpR YerC/YecD [Lachnospiraceae bacterium]
MSKELRTKAMDRLLDAIRSMKDDDELYAFLQDLCTISELEAFAQRFEVAEELHNRRTYQEIVKTTGASTATISRVNRALNYGEDGYVLAIRRLAQKEDIKSEQ